MVALALSLNANAQIPTERSPEVAAQIQQNFDSGAAEWDGISMEYSFTFREVITTDDAATIDGKMPEIYQEIESIETTPTAQGTVMKIVVPMFTDRDYVKQMAARFGYSMLNIEKQLVLSR